MEAPLGGHAGGGQEHQAADCGKQHLGYKRTHAAAVQGAAAQLANQIERLKRNILQRTLISSKALQWHSVPVPVGVPGWICRTEPTRQPPSNQPSATPPAVLLSPLKFKCPAALPPAHVGPVVHASVHGGRGRGQRQARGQRVSIRNLFFLLLSF